MKRRLLLLVLAGAACAAALVLPEARAASLSADQRKELNEIKKELGKVPGLITKRETDEASKILDDVEQRARKLQTDAKLPDNDPNVSSLLKQVEQRRKGLGKKAGGANAATVSYSKDVAPILSKHCGNCHGATNPKGGLRLDGFEGVSGAVAAGNPNSSELLKRVTAQGEKRMPKNGPPLSPAEIQTLAAWVTQGAKNDAAAGNAEAPRPVNNTPVQIVRATGNETVSFTKDIAPFMSNLCVNCHSGNNARAGFSLETFEALMRGGKSGRVVLPGNPEDSRLWHLVGKQDPIKMPQGQALITRANWNNLRTWIEEGAKFDGPDPKTPLRQLVPTEAQIKAKELAALSDEELTKRHVTAAEELWKAALANEPAELQQTSDFILMGNVPAERLKHVADWAEEDVQTMRKFLSLPAGPLVRGKLIVFVFKERFAYEEFARTNENVEIPVEATGHSRVSPELAYVCLQDVGDEVRSDAASVHINLIDHLTGSVLKRSPKKVPDWLIRGTGLSLAARLNPKGTFAYFQAMNSVALDLVRTLDKPTDIFADGTFSTTNVGPVGYSLVQFMLKQGGEQNFVKFIRQLESGTEMTAALGSVYNANKASLAKGYVESLAGSKPARKKK